MNPFLSSLRRPGGSFSRVSGDEPGVGVQVVIPNAFSPREWG